jgi:Transposase
MTHGSPEACAAFGGLDWAEAQHDGCLQPAGSATRACFQLEPTPEAIDAWVTTLRTRCNGHPVAIGLARTKGPLVSALRQYDFLVLFPINPLTLARYRAAFTPSRATDDPTDAALPLAVLLTQRDTLPPLQPQRPRCAPSPSSSHTVAVWSATVCGAPTASPGPSRTLSRPCCPGCRRKPPPSAAPSCVAGQLARRCNSRAVRPSQPSSGSIPCALPLAWPSVSRPSNRPPLAPPMTASSRPMRSWCRPSSRSFGAPCRPSPISTLLAHSARSAIPISPCARPSQTRAPASPPGGSSPSANHAHARPLPPHAKNRPGWRRCPHGAARSPGCPGASRVHRSSGTRASHGRRNRSDMPSGPRCTTSRNATRARPIRPPYEPWPSNGSASSLGAGRSARHTMRPPLARRCITVAHRCSTIWRRPREKL